MITDMKRYCIGSPGWKYIDHDRTMTVSQWIEELINHSEESYLLLISVFDKELEDKLLIRISRNGISIPIIGPKYCDYCSRKVFCAKWSLGLDQGLSFSETMWDIQLFI